MACEITGVGVYPACASSITSTPFAANTSSALARAGSDSAWVSIPMNSGPDIPALLPVLTNRLTDRQDMPLIERQIER